MAQTIHLYNRVEYFLRDTPHYQEVEGSSELFLFLLLSCFAFNLKNLGLTFNEIVYSQRCEMDQEMY